MFSRLFNFKASAISPIGLDISDLCLKIVQLEQVRSRIRIRAIEEIQLPEGLIKDGIILDRPRVVEKIKKITSNPNLNYNGAQNVIACLPESKTFIKLIKIQKAQEDARKTIEKEIEKYVPVAISDLYYDWQIIDSNQNNYHVLIGAAPRKIVDQYIDMLYAADLCISALEIEPVAICRGLLPAENPDFKGEKKNNYAILDLGSVHSSLTVYSHNTILFSLRLSFAGQAITAKIARKLKISIDQAESAKIICGLKGEFAGGEIKNILEEEMKALAKQLKKVISFYEESFGYRGPIAKIILCGGGAYIKNLDKLIQKFINIPTEQGSILTNLGLIEDQLIKIPTEKYSLDPGILKASPSKAKKKPVKILSYTQNTALEFNTAMGLALRGLFVN